jgi:hypothetical protein
MTETQNITHDIIPVIGKTYDWYGTLAKVVGISSEERPVREHSDGSISPATTLYRVEIEYNSPRFGLSRIKTPWTKYSFVPIEDN